MSEVVLDTITGKSTATTITIGSTPVVSASANSMTIRGEGSAQTSIQQGLVKCWVKNNEGANDLDSFNISSITDNGTGDYTETLTNAFSSTNFSYNGTCNNFSYNTIFLQSVATNSARLTLQGVLGGSNRNGVVGSMYCGDLA